MVVLSAAIVGKGKILLSRQFSEFTKNRIENLLNAFIKLVETGTKEHNFIETDQVRYVYQPLEEHYIVVTTNKTSNIIEDIETIRLLANIVQSTCTVIDESSILENAFSIIFGIDEVISFGYKESVTITQVHSYIEMDSHEEHLQKMIEQSKIFEANETAKRKQMELSKLKMTNPNSNNSVSSSLVAPSSSPTPTNLNTQPLYEKETVKDTNIHSQNAPKKGMQLGKKPARIL